MIGAGGAARAVVHAIDEAGIGSIVILNRTVARAEALAERFGARVHAGGLDALPKWLAAADVVVNTTSAEMAGHGNLAIDWSLARAAAIATEPHVVETMKREW